MTDPLLNYIALFMLFFVVLVMFYGIIVIHDIPYEIAHKRNHPHQDAIHAAGWVSIFTLHAMWPFLWIWAMMYRPERGWGFGTVDNKNDATASADSTALNGRVDQLLKRVAELEAERQLPRPAKAPRALPPAAAQEAAASLAVPAAPEPVSPEPKRKTG